jgi:hypothetical protein
MVQVLVSVLSLSLCWPAFAATPYKRSLNVKKNAYMSDGVFIGGKAGHGASLLGVRRQSSKKLQMERVVLDLGDKETKTSREMPFYQVSVDAAQKRIVLDLAQLKFSKVTESQLKSLFMKSQFVESVALSFDPEDKGATMVLNLKRPMRLEVFQMMNKNKPARVVMDLKPLNGAIFPKSRG